MKFSEMPYRRPDVEALFATMDDLTARMKNAPSAEAQLTLLKEADALASDFLTMGSICYVRNTIDTRDEF